MKKKVHVLLTGIGCPGGVSIIQSLKMDPHIEIVGTDMREDIAAKYLVKKFYTVPGGLSEFYIRSVLQIVEDEKIDVILPCATFELDALSFHKELFKKRNCEVCVSDHAGHQIANDRYMMSCKFEGESFIPRFSAPEDWEDMCRKMGEFGWPEKKVVIKPFVSHGSIGLRIADDDIDSYKQYRYEKPYLININFGMLEQIFKGREFGDILLQEYLPGQEWEVDLLLSPSTHKVIAGSLREQGEVVASASERSVLTTRADILEIGKYMAEKLNLSYTINLSIKLAEDGTPKVTEMNPRLGAGMFLPISGGLNFPLFSVYLAKGIRFGLREPDYWLSMYIYRGYLVVNDRGNIINQTEGRHDDQRINWDF